MEKSLYAIASIKIWLVTTFFIGIMEIMFTRCLPVSTWFLVASETETFKISSKGLCRVTLNFD